MDDIPSSFPECPVCHGVEPYETPCRNCQGTGAVANPRRVVVQAPGDDDVTCSDCRGEGYILVTFEEWGCEWCHEEFMRRDTERWEQMQKVVT